MGLEASVQFEDEALIAAEAEFGADFVDEAEGVEAVDADEREDEFIAARREASGVQRTLDATQMYLSEIGFSPLLTAGWCQIAMVHGRVFIARSLTTHGYCAPPIAELSLLFSDSTC